MEDEKLIYQIVPVGDRDKIVQLLGLACAMSDNAVVSESAALAGILRQPHRMTLDNLWYPRKAEAIAHMMLLQSAIAYAQGYRLGVRAAKEGDFADLTPAEMADLKSDAVGFRLVKGM